MTYIYNGLKGSDLILFNELIAADLSRPISLREIATKTNYEYRTILFAAERLEEMGLIARKRESVGRPYHYQILNGSNN